MSGNGRPPAAPAMRWHGWGSEAGAVSLPPHVLEFLREEVGAEAEPSRPVALEDVRLPEPRLPGRVRDRLARLVGAGGVLDDREARVVHATGKSYPDLVRQRAGDAGTAPDAVVLPGDHDAVRSVLELCAAEGVAVVPFGGGTSVVGGVDALRGDHAAVISLDLGRMAELTDLDERSLTVSAGPGLRAPAADALLGERGLTLGHSPQSYEFVSLGGAVATRSAGQASTGFGRIDEMVVGLRLAAPSGEVDLRARPRTAAGPDLRELVVGSEGTLGVLTRVDLRVRPRRETLWSSWFVHSFHEGIEALRRLEHEGCAPAVARLSDEDETRLSMALAGASAKTRLFGAYLRARRRRGGCLIVVGWDGTPEETAGVRTPAADVLRRCGAMATGQGPAKAWVAGRFRTPYLRDAMLDHGVMAETLETATQWSRLEELHAAVRDALRSSLGERGTPPLVMCHVSHLYPTGASLYFTFVARQEKGAELEQWRAAKQAAGDAIVRAGGTITHHHAIGRDHRPWMKAEVGEGGLRLLRAAKAELDLAGIMNPGKLLP